MAGFTKHKMSDLANARKVAKAQRVLGLHDQTFDAGDVRTMFAHLVKRSHTDTAGGDIVEVDLMQLRRAKDLLINHLENKDD